ncbi:MULTISPECIES: site-specific integrase [unclassified Flavobacterium]|uniref:site-specific integrase n=1 Tax=unclassified Flavobacterium TaxID=196869 RepID=UPI00131D338F|nr:MULTISPECIES: site-specific integrase [unclassified Flavobacterium]
MTNASIKIVLGSKPMSNGYHTVYLSVIKNRKRKNISLGLKCLKENFGNEQFTKKHNDYKAENLLLNNYKSRANQIIRDFQLDNLNYTLADFEVKFRGTDAIEKDINVIDFYNEIIDEMTRSGNISNARAYQSTRDSIVKFKGKKIKFKDINTTFLEKYEVFLRENGNQNGGISFKMRGFKALFNKARNRQIIPKNPYPFENYKVSKLKGATTKRALTIEDVKKVLKINILEYPHLQNTFNYFLFSYYCRGINFIDMMKLKWSNIQGENIYYTRSKTKRQFVIRILEPVSLILNYYRKSQINSQFIFPILVDENMNPTQFANRRINTLKKFNNDLKELAKIAGVDSNISSYVIRHSYATNMKFLGVSSDIISQSMGHSNVEITQSYLKEFENVTLDIENEKLLDL